jgi:hypothetical protein
MKTSIIPAEIKNDELYNRIINTILLFNEEIETVLEVGASSGDGSTEAIVRAMSQLEDKELYTLEVDLARFAALQERYKDLDWVIPVNKSAVHLNEYPTKGQVEDFYNTIKTQLNQYPIEFVLSWYDTEIEKVEYLGDKIGGIDQIKKDNNIENFDMVILDGSPFTGYQEFLKIVGAKIIVLDDIIDIKHHFTQLALRENEEYECIFCNAALRNGYAIWVKRDII